MRHVGDDPLRHTCFDCIPIVIAPIGEGFDVGRFQHRRRTEGSRGQRILVSDGMRDLMRRDQLMVMIHSQRHIVTDVSALFGLHRPALGISSGDWQGTTSVKLRPQVFVVLLAGLSWAYFLVQLISGGRVDVGLGRVLLIQLFEIGVNRFMNLLKSRREVSLAEITIFPVDRFELAAINGKPFTAT